MIRRFEQMSEKPVLKCVTETVYRVDYRDLEDFVQSIYGGDYEFVAVQECGNDSSHRFDVDGKACEGPLGKFNQPRADQIRNGTYPTYHNRLVLDCLVKDGYIPAGIYIIRVSW